MFILFKYRRTGIDFPLFPQNHCGYSNIRKLVEYIDLMKGWGSMQNFTVQKYKLF